MDTVIGWFISFFWDALRGFGIFLALWYPRNYAEKRWLKRRLGRKKAVRPPDHTDTAAIASVSSAFGNHH